jgi:Peptidase family M28
LPKPPPALILLLLATSAQAQQHPRDKEIHDADTRAWWHTTESLAGDRMEGRDTGSAAYQRAAELVAARFRKAGLQPAGNAGSFFQSVPLHESAVDANGTSFTLVRDRGSEQPIAFLQQITINAAPGLPSEIDAPLTFRGYCGKEAMQQIDGKIVVCFGTQRQGLPSAAERTANARAGRARGILNVDDPYFTIEPPRWPAAYARTVALNDAAPATPANAQPPDPLLVMRLSAEVLPNLLAGTGQDSAAILASGGHQQTLASFDLPARLRVRLHLTQRSYSSPNIVATLPGTDSSLKNEYVVIAAHLDGYGYGTPVQGDKLYNGALDDAAYVALLIQFAENLHRQHPALKRSLLFCAFTGEEKGLLGSNYFVQHPTIPISQLAADINLDQLRPLFPLRILTALAIDDSTLGTLARQIGTDMGIQLRPDAEAERNLLRRADHYPFLRAGVPAIGFIFGYDAGTDSERRYREWYQVRYHRPQDDLTQPIDFDAAAEFNQFFYKLTQAVADVAERPSLKPDSTFRAANK